LNINDLMVHMVTVRFA